MKINRLLLLPGVIMSMLAFDSCEYKEFAAADYPETTIYLPMARDGVWRIEAPNIADPVEELTPGGPKRYEIDREGGKFILFLGVVQAGVERKSFDVDISMDYSAVNRGITDGIFPTGTIPLPESAYSLPSVVRMLSGDDSALFRMYIDLDVLTEVNANRKYAVAVKVSSPSVAVNKDMDTAVILIDASFIQALL